jgi:CheY-like chemotaxis protein
MSTQQFQNVALSDGNSTALPKAQSSSGRQVLIVDDMSTTRVMLSRYVRQLGHQDTTASNGREALELLTSQKFDLILLDVMMPEMDGYTVLETMKSDAEFRDIPVVMISGVDEIESVVRCIERGAEDYLPKPFNATLLRARISACLEKKRLWDELGENYRRLQELERLRDSLTDMIVHDLRTPLASFITGLQTMESLGALSDLQRECLSLSLDGGQTLLSMIMICSISAAWNKAQCLSSTRC